MLGCIAAQPKGVSIEVSSFLRYQNIDGDLGDGIAAYLQDLANHHEDWQVQQAREAVCLYRYFKGVKTVIPAEKEQPDGQVSWQAVEEEVIRALRLPWHRDTFHITSRTYRTY